MDAKVKKAWVKALRSGKYKQGKNFLAQRKPHEKTRYCCLGVLCDITPDAKRVGISKGGVISFKMPGDEYPEEAYLPRTLDNRVGLEFDDVEYLVQMNDAGKSFEEIADYIEKNL